MEPTSKTWLITGVSRGFGREFARQLLARGDRVIGTTRDGKTDLTASNGQLTVAALDVTDPEAVRRVVDAAFSGGRVDVVVNNAGYGLLSTVEGATEDEIGHVMEVNFHGPRRVMQAALPHLRRQRSGHIVNITSIAGVAAGAGAGYYAASKYALEGLSQSLAREIAPLGLRLTLVEPGAFRTDFLAPQSIRTNEAVGPDYAATAGAAMERLARTAGAQRGDPAKAVWAILQAVESPNPPLQLVLGPDAFRRADERLRAFQADLEAWRQVGMSTDHPDFAEA